MDRNSANAPQESLAQRLRRWARALKQELRALALAVRDQRTPWYAKLWLSLVLAYALSPIDLIPDFIPLLGYLDDVLLVPAGIWIGIRLVPPAVLSECRVQAATAPRPARRWQAVPLIIGLWLLLAYLLWRWLW